MPYELKLDQYQGPLDKLLELIEERKLEVNAISLAQVTDDFLKYLETLKNADTKLIHADDEKDISINQQQISEHQRNANGYLRLLADFIAIASQLIFLKSKSLLPDLELSPEEESGIRDLEWRLKLRREFRPAIRAIDELWKRRTREWSRPYFLNVASFAGGTARVFYPGGGLTAARLGSALQAIVATVERLVAESGTIRDTIVSLEEKVKEIVERFTRALEIRFRDLTEARPRAEAIITFLAILHLARERLVLLEQKAHFSDIMIRKSGGPGGG